MINGTCWDYGKNGTEAITMTYHDHTVAMVVPAYNEATQIEGVVAGAPDFIDTIVIIDDASTDDTVAVVESLKTTYPKVTLLRHETNQGVGGAIATGYVWCRENALDVVVKMDGDGQMNPDDLPALLDPIVAGEVEYTKGNRLVYQKSSRLIPPVRFLGNSVLSLLTKIASGYWHVADSQSGYTAISKKALQVIRWTNMYKRYGQPNDLLVRLNVHNFKVRDIPMKPVYHVGETSKMRIPKVLLPISTMLVRGFLWRLWTKYIVRDFHPLVFFYALGALFTVFWIGLSIRFVYLWALFGHAPPMTTLAMLFCFAMAMQFLLFAMLFDMEANRDLR